MSEPLAGEPPGPPGPGRGLPGDAPPDPGDAAAAPTVPARRWRPWTGRARVRDIACLAGLVLSSLYGLAMIPLTPSLISTHPVLLEVLSGSTPSIVAAGSFSDVDSKVQMTVVVAAALVGLMKFDLLFWWAGRLWGHGAVQWLGARNGRAAALARMAGQRGSRFAGLAVLLTGILPGVPAPLVYAAAGWVGLGLVPFLVFDLIGSAAWAALLAGLGYELGPAGVHAANLVSHYALLAIIAALVAVAAPHAWQIMRARRVRLAVVRAAMEAVPGVGALDNDDAAEPVP
jgi:membrane protein DedA with SNARE-associated domain